MAPSARRAWLGVCLAAVAVFLFVADSGLMALSLPEIAREFPTASRSQVGWVASGFLVAQASLLLVGGRLGDRRGRKRFYLFGLAVFTVGAFAVSVAPTLPLIIAARAVQGAGGAFLTSGALPLVLPLFPTHKAPTVIGVWGGIGSVAAWATPTLGGLLVTHNWRYAFGAVVPIGAIAFLLGRRVLPEQAVNDAGDGTDRLSLLIGPPALGALMLVLSQGGRWGWGSRATLAVGLGATLTLVGFVRRSHRVATPLLDVALFSNREFSVNVVAGSLQQAGFFAWFLTAPLIMNEVWGWSPRNAGFALALSQILASVGSPTGGWVVGRAGPYTVIVLGALINVAGALWLVVMAGPEPDFWVGYVPAALMLGFGASWCGTATSGGGLAALSAGQLGLGNSVQQLVRRVGGSVGVAIAIALLGDAKGDALLVGAKRVWWMAVFVHVAMLVPLLLIDRPFARSRAVRPSS